MTTPQIGTRFTVTGHPVPAENGTFEMTSRDNQLCSWVRIMADGKPATNQLARNRRWGAWSYISKYVTEGK